MKSCLAFFLAFVSLVANPLYAEKSPSNQVLSLAPGYGDLNFTAPVAGTYKLPILSLAGDGNVLDSKGNATTLHTLFGNPDKVVVLSFIYSTCSDVNGCPLAMAVLHKLKNRLEKQPQIARHLRLITLSFNPEYDTPERMKAFGTSLESNNLDWLFLTTRSEKELQPILHAYKQTADKVYGGNGKFTNTFNHNLRVYLIDQHKQLRNIYNSELLHPDTLISDIQTLLQAVSSHEAPVTLNRAALYSAGDNKAKYESPAYQTDSIALAQRQGKAADLLKTLKQPPLGLPPVTIPADNPITTDKVNLGRKLFYDRRLSINNTFSCAMCHIPEQGFTSNEMATAVGVEGRTVRRNSPTLYNVAYAKTLFHDGRESTLEQQVWGPFLAQNEMANPAIGYVIDKINNSADYGGLFERAFGKLPNMETIGMAIASYERTLNSGNSPFDRWHYGKNEQVIDDKAKRGFKLFTGKAGCNQCHVIGNDSALFTDNLFHNTGIGYEAAMQKNPGTTQRVQVAPGVFANVPSEVINSVAETKTNDLGRYEITQNPQDRWRYKTPSLRNVSLTAPYMHNGSLASLREVVEFYSRGGIANENLDPLIKPLHLSKQEVDDVATFLEALTGDNAEELISDAYTAPIGDSE